MISKLTKDQEKLLENYKDKWLKIGLGTGPADRIKAEDAINRSYKIAGLEPPKQIIWSTSPLAGALVINILKNEKIMNDIFKTKVKTGQSVGESVWQSVWQSVRQSVGESVGESAWQSVRQSVGQSVGESVGQSVWQEINNAGCGSHDAAWLGYYNYFLEVLKIEACQKLIPLMDFAKEGGWFYPYKNICVVSERPIEIHLNKDNKIHKDGSPAILYPDGFAIWGLNGVRVPQWLAEDCPTKIGEELVKLTDANQRKEGLKRIAMHTLKDEKLVEDMLKVQERMLR